MSNPEATAARDNALLEMTWRRKPGEEPDSDPILFWVTSDNGIEIIILLQMNTIKPDSTKCVERRFSVSVVVFMIKVDMIRYLGTVFKSALSRGSYLLMMGWDLSWNCFWLAKNSYLSKEPLRKPPPPGECSHDKSATSWWL